MDPLWLAQVHLSSTRASSSHLISSIAYFSFPPDKEKLFPNCNYGLEAKKFDRKWMNSRPFFVWECVHALFRLLEGVVRWMYNNNYYYYDSYHTVAFTYWDQSQRSVSAWNRGPKEERAPILNHKNREERAEPAKMEPSSLHVILALSSPPPSESQSSSVSSELQPPPPLIIHHFV